MKHFAWRNLHVKGFKTLAQNYEKKKKKKKIRREINYTHDRERQKIYLNQTTIFFVQIVLKKKKLQKLKKKKELPQANQKGE